MDTQANHIFTYIFLTYAFVLLIFSFFLYHLRSYHKKIQKAQADKNKVELAQIEKERINLATELHHDLSPQLASLNLILNELENEQNKELIRRGNQTIAVVMNQVRRQIRQLSPISFLQANFLDALHHLIEQFRIAHPQIQIHVTNNCYFDLQNEPSNHLYRIIQEIMLNTVKHANAENLYIDFSIEKNQLIIRTADDGVGFRKNKNKNKNKKSEGFGLLSIQNRLDELNGVIVKNHQLNKGTQYHISIPRHWEKTPPDYFSRS